MNSPNHMITNFRESTTLGRTGLQVSRIGIGSGYGVPSHAIERAYHEHGVNYFFWSSPRRKGMEEAVRHLSRTEREKMVVVLQTYDHIGLFMHHFIEKGLKSLKIEFADILILGWFNHIPNERVLNAALELKKEGKIRFIGMSGHNRPVFGQLAQQNNTAIDVYMVRYNAVNRGAEEDVFPHLSGKNRPGIVTYTTTCWGKLLKASKMPHGKSPLTSTDCYRFALSNKNVDLCLTGPKNQDEMDEALRTLDSSSLSNNEMEHIKYIGDYIHGRVLASI